MFSGKIKRIKIRRLLRRGSAAANSLGMRLIESKKKLTFRFSSS